MEIIKKGELPEDKQITIDCRDCKTKFRFQKKEAIQRYDQRDGDFIEIKCPVCNKQQYIANSVIHTFIETRQTF